MIPFVDQRAFRNFDPWLLLIVVTIFGIGLVNLRSGSMSYTGGSGWEIPLRQLTWFGIGLVIMVPVVLIDYRIWERLAYPLFGFALLLLVGVIFVGSSTAGVRRWFSLGGIAFQPSEPAKLALIIMLAKYFQDHPRDTSYRLQHLIFPGVFIGLPVFLLVLEPDLGTALLYLSLGTAMVLFVGVQRRSLATGIVLGFLLTPILWMNLKDYQKQRILTFVDPDRDPLGAGYQVIQSKIAVGSGCFFGKGYLQGTQTQLKFLPEQHTDFVFSVFSEERGFFGVAIALALFALLTIWALQIGAQAKDRFGALVSFGIAMLFLIQTFFNIGMVVGILPVVGMTLPFFSYGGSSLITGLIGIALLLNIRMRRYMF